MITDIVVRAVAYLVIGLALVPILRWAGSKAGYHWVLSEPESAGFVIVFWPLVLSLVALVSLGHVAARPGPDREDETR